MSACRLIALLQQLILPYRVEADKIHTRLSGLFARSIACFMYLHEDDEFVNGRDENQKLRSRRLFFCELGSWEFFLLAFSFDGVFCASETQKFSNLKQHHPICWAKTSGGFCCCDFYELNVRVSVRIHGKSHTSSLIGQLTFNTFELRLIDASRLSPTLSVIIRKALNR